MSSAYPGHAFVQMDARSDNEGDAVGQVRDEVTRRKKMEALLRSSRIMASTRETRDLCCRWPAPFSTSCSARGTGTRVQETFAMKILIENLTSVRIIRQQVLMFAGSTSIRQVHHHRSTFDVNFNSTPPYPVVLRPLKHPTPTQIRMKWKRG